jgi:FkbM family methyltransferase
MLTRLLTRFGRLDRIATYELGTMEFRVPLGRIAWDFPDVMLYEAKLMQSFAKAVDALQEATLFDCGADIGTFSALLASRTDRIARIMAFEPNSEVREILDLNLSSLRIPYQLIPKAVGKADGRGWLERPADNLTDHARYLVQGDGPLEVVTIDGFHVRGGDVALKFDIEGGELEAIQGAAQTIASARNCVIAVEAHPLVAKRTGRDPGETLRFLQSIRPFRFIVSETGVPPSLDGALIGRDQTEIWNIVGTTSEGKPH